MIEIDNRQTLINVSSQMESLMRNVAEKVLEYEQFKEKAEIDIIITDNQGIRELNRKYRNIDRATDVLSFPMLDFDDGYEESGSVEVSVEDMDPDNDEVVLGDIVISAQRAGEQAEEYGHSIERETAFLVVHSMLHLLGYDHELDEDRKIMRYKEEEILNLLNLSR